MAAFGLNGSDYSNFGYKHSSCSTSSVEKSITTAAYSELIRILRDARAGAGVSQQQLAEVLGEPQSFVSKYESGSRRLDLVELREIANALGLSLSSLVEKFEKSL